MVANNSPDKYSTSLRESVDRSRQMQVNERPPTDGLRMSGVFNMGEMDRAVEFLFREHCPPGDKGRYRIFPCSTLARSMRESVRMEEDTLRADWLIFPVPTITNEGNRIYILIIVSYPSLLLKKNKHGKGTPSGCNSGIWLYDA